MELHRDEVEQDLIKKDEEYGYVDIYDCDQDDYNFHERCANDYFILKNIDIVESFNASYELTSKPLNYVDFFQHYNEIYYKIDFKNINKNTTHPLVLSLVNNFKALENINIFKVYFLFFKDKWSNRDDLKFDVVIAVDEAMLYHRPSRFSLSEIDSLHAPEYADTLFKKMVFNDIERRPKVYSGFDDIEGLINNFEASAWMIDAITY